MNVADSRIVVTRPGGTAAGIAILPHPGMSSDGGRLIAGQSFLMYVARGTGRYQAGRSSGVLRPNTLVSAPAGTFRCEPDDDQFEMYVVVGGARAADPHDPLAFAPTFARRLDDIDGRRWRDRMADAALTAERGRLTLREAQTIADDALPLVWRPGRDAARATLEAVFERAWDRIAEPLSLGSLADEAGYTPNYLNDLARAATGRPVGAWLMDLRMSRARAFLEATDLPIASIALACGFDDPSYFARVFRAAHGVTAATWRLSARPDDPRFTSVAVTFDDYQAAMDVAEQTA